MVHQLSPHLEEEGPRTCQAILGQLIGQGVEAVLHQLQNPLRSQDDGSVGEPNVDNGSYQHCVKACSKRTFRGALTATTHLQQLQVRGELPVVDRGASGTAARPIGLKRVPSFDLIKARLSAPGGIGRWITWI